MTAKKLFWLLAGIACTMPAGAAGEGKSWHAVRGAALQALLAGQDLGDGVHYAYQFQRPAP